MKLKDVRKLGIRYCEENNCNYTYISHDNIEEFYLTEEEDKHTVFFVNKNGSLRTCRSTEYAIGFHKELKKRKNKRNNDKRKLADIYNQNFEEDIEGDILEEESVF